jgi:hypothetical protein
MGCVGSKNQGEEAPPKKEPKKDDRPNKPKDDGKKAENGKDEPKENGHKPDGSDKPGDGSDDDKNKAQEEKVDPISPGDVEEFYKFGKEIGKYVHGVALSLFYSALLCLCSIGSIFRMYALLGVAFRSSTRPQRGQRERNTPLSGSRRMRRAWTLSF